MSAHTTRAVRHCQRPHKIQSKIKRAWKFFSAGNKVVTQHRLLWIQRRRKIADTRLILPWSADRAAMKEEARPVRLIRYAVLSCRTGASRFQIESTCHPKVVDLHFSFRTLLWLQRRIYHVSKHDPIYNLPNFKLLDNNCSAGTTRKMVESHITFCKSMIWNCT